MLSSLLVLLVAINYGNANGVIYVSHDGSSESSCGARQVPCTFSASLGRLYNDTIIYIEPAEYVLSNPTEFSYVSNIAIIGHSSDANKVVIKCQNHSGLSFIYSNNITLNSVTFVGCGALRNSTMWDYNHTETYRTLPYHVTLYFLFCNNVEMTNIVVQKSNGTGITLYNTVGSVMLSHLQLYDNAPKNYTFGGGGLQIEFSFCIPGNYTCPHYDDSPVPTNYTQSALYTIKNSHFSSNYAFRGHYQPFRTSHGRNTYNFGKGGGISIIMKGNASRNNVTIINCTLDQNKAHLGGGLFVKFNDRVKKNIVTIINSILSQNLNHDIKTLQYDFDACGGGSKIEYFHGERKNELQIVSENKVHFLNCTFSYNKAISGGGIGMEVKNTFMNDVFNVEHCHFQSNEGFLGSALFLQQTNALGGGNDFMASFRTCTFNDNVPVCLNQSSVQYYASLPCTGAIYTRNCHIEFSGNVTFTRNNATPIEIHYSSVKFNSDSSIIFTENSGGYGGAIALHNCAQMIVSPKTYFNFTKNVAKHKGGAIYIGTCARSSTISEDCFIQYSNLTVHPDHWHTSFVFYNNKADEYGNAIYADNFSPCWWPISNFSSELVPSQTFCWKPWMFESKPSKCNDSNGVSSGPAFLQSRDNGTASIYPGQTIHPPYANDSRKYLLKDVSFRVCAMSPALVASEASKDGAKCTTSNQSVIVLCSHSQGCNESESLIVFETLELQQPLQVAIIATIKSCKWPYQFHSTKHKCVLTGNVFCCDSKCQEECSFSDKVWTNYGYCYSTKNQSEGFVYGVCPLGYCYYGKTFHAEDIVSYCHAMNRGGRLCGRCTESYGVPINSPYLECTKCSSYGLLWFLLLEMLPVTLMVIIILILSIKLTSSYMYGFVFYCQIISINFPGWFYPVWFTNSKAHTLFSNMHSESLTLSTQLTFPFSIWNINFMTIVPPRYTSICISKSMNPTSAIAFWYVIALYPLVIVSLLYMWLKMYDRSNRVVVCITRPIHKFIARFWQAFDISPSLADCIASIYILCYTQIAATSLKLLHYTTWQSLYDEHKSGKAFFYNAEMKYFDGIHIFYGLSAIIILISIILLPSLLLTLYQFKIFLKVLELVKIRKYMVIGIFVDAFTSEFRNGTRGKRDHRFFAGLYLLLRVFIMCFYYLPYYHYKVLLLLKAGTALVAAGVIMIFRPYKKLCSTLIDFFLFMILASISFLNYFTNTTTPVLPSVAVLMYLPLCGCLIYFGYCFCTRIIIYFCKKRYSLQHMALIIADNGCEYDDTLPDRILRPDAYNCQASRLITSDPLDEPLEEENASLSLAHNTSTDRPRPTTPIEPTQSTVSISDTGYGSIN